MDAGKLKNIYYDAPGHSVKPSNKDSPKGEKLEGVKLVQDFFGFYYDDNRQCSKIKRFTWTNHNQIQVQVINYGARIISIKYPDRKGVLDDIVLGFDDLAGYIFYQKYHFGATIGRMTNVVKNSQYKIGDKEYRLEPNMNNGHHRDGGVKGFDQIVWKTGIQGKKVFMTHMSPHGHQGYPGNLLVRLTFELSTMNEFKIDMEAYTTEPTIVNLSNLLFLNLGGHHTGPDSIQNHIVMVNCNSYTKQDKYGMCNGQISNVVHTPLDFQTPKTLGKWIGLVPEDGYYQNMCINRGVAQVTQEDCFVARIRHPGSGRFIEIYSNQLGVQFNTANHFGFGHTLSMERIGLTKKISIKPEVLAKPEDISLTIIDCLHGKMLETLRFEEETYYTGFKKFIQLLQKASYKPTPIENQSIVTAKKISVYGKDFKSFIENDRRPLDGLECFTCSPDQMTYLTTLEAVLKEESFDDTADWLRRVIEKLIYFATKNAESTLMQENVDSDSDSDEDTRMTRSSRVYSTFRSERLSSNIIPSQIPEDNIANNEKIRINFNNCQWSVDQEVEKTEINGGLPTKILTSPAENIIPPYYKSCNEIVGKGKAVYKRHGGIAFQTQNYPNCANIDKFPSCVLKPGETYRHTITYKFWIRSGNPSRWLKRTVIDIAAKKLKLQQQQQQQQQQK